MPLITFTAPMGCGGQQVAKLVAQGLDLELFDDERLLLMGADAGIPTQGLEDIRRPGFFHRLFSTEPQAYLNYMDSIVYQVSKQGTGVIVGHGSQMLLRDFDCALHVLVHAPESLRIQNVAEKKQLSAKAAQKLIHKTDSRQKGLFRLAFEKDLDDPSLYDMTINTAKLGPETAAKFIIAAADSELVNACSLNALDSMEKLSLAKQIHAALLDNDLDNHMLNIEVAELGVVEISGLAHGRDTVDGIVEVVKATSGVKEVKTEISIIPSITRGGDFEKQEKL